MVIEIGQNTLIGIMITAFMIALAAMIYRRRKALADTGMLVVAIVVASVSRIGRIKVVRIVSRKARNNRTYFGLVAAVLIYWWSTDFIEWLDPSAGSYEKGHVQRWIYLGATALVINSLVNIVMKVSMPKMYHYFKNGDGHDDFSEISKTQALWIHTVFYCALALAFAVAFLAL